MHQREISNENFRSDHNLLADTQSSNTCMASFGLYFFGFDFCAFVSTAQDSTVSSASISNCWTEMRHTQKFTIIHWEKKQTWAVHWGYSNTHRSIFRKCTWLNTMNQWVGLHEPPNDLLAQRRQHFGLLQSCYSRISDSIFIKWQRKTITNSFHSFQLKMR